MPRSCFLNSLLQDLSSWEDRHLLLLDWDHCPLGAQLCSQNLLPIGSGGFGQAAPCWAMRNWLGRIGICHEVRCGSPSPEGESLAQHPRVRRPACGFSGKSGVGNAAGQLKLQFASCNAASVYVHRIFFCTVCLDECCKIDSGKGWIHAFRFLVSALYNTFSQWC